jgi:hypothetical protein
MQHGARCMEHRVFGALAKQSVDGNDDFSGIL